MLIGFLPSDGILLLLALGLFIGSMFALLNGAIIAIIQVCVEPGMHGRILALIQSLAMSAAPIGLVAAGPLADIIGVQPWFIIAGASMLISGILSFFMPSIMNLEQARRPEPRTDMESTSAGD